MRDASDCSKALAPLHTASVYLYRFPPPKKKCHLRQTDRFDLGHDPTHTPTLFTPVQCRQTLSASN